jgi:hypothetical protein
MTRDPDALLGCLKQRVRSLARIEPANRLPIVSVNLIASAKGFLNTECTSSMTNSTGVSSSS